MTSERERDTQTIEVCQFFSTESTNEGSSGTGEAEIKAAIRLSGHGFNSICIIRIFLTRSHMVKAQDGMKAALGCMTENDCG